MKRTHVMMMALAAMMMAACGEPAGEGEGEGEGEGRAAAILALTGDSTAGQALYDNNCAICHGADAASGSANENLAGNIESELSEYVDIVLAGKNNGAMPSFEDQLSDQEIADILAYIKSL